MLESIEYLTKKSEYRVNDINNLDAKNLAVTNANKMDMNKVYPNNVSTNTNADMLSQSFGNNMNNNVSEQKVEQTPVQVTAIPTQNIYNMEANPVDLNTVNQVSEDNIQNNGINNTVQANGELNVPSLETDVSMNANIFNDAPILEPIQVSSNNNGIDSGFKVSNEPNIFDNPQNVMPFSISQEDISKPLDDNKDNLNKIEQSEENKVVPFPIFDNKESDNYSDSINDDIIQGQIAIEESNIKYYEGLAENSRKKIELLKRQIKSKKEEDNLENTASNLFNNNGVLDEQKVLGKTPFPNITAA